jgi:hypothetical protein
VRRGLWLHVGVWSACVGCCGSRRQVARQAGLLAPSVAVEDSILKSGMLVIAAKNEPGTSEIRWTDPSRVRTRKAPKIPGTPKSFAGLTSIPDFGAESVHPLPATYPSEHGVDVRYHFGWEIRKSSRCLEVGLGGRVGIGSNSSPPISILLSRRREKRRET